MGLPSSEDIQRIEKKLDAIMGFFSISIDPVKKPQTVIDLRLRAQRSAARRRVKEGERESQR